MDGPLADATVEEHTLAVPGGIGEYRRHRATAGIGPRCHLGRQSAPYPRVRGTSQECSQHGGRLPAACPQDGAE